MKNTLLVSLMIAAGVVACTREDAGGQGGATPSSTPPASTQSAPPASTQSAGGTGGQTPAPASPSPGADGAGTTSSPTKPSPTTNTPGAMGEIAPTAPNADALTRHPGAGAASTGSGAPADTMSETERKVREEQNQPPPAGNQRQ